MSLRYLLEIGSFLRSEGQDPIENSVAPAALVETSLNAPSSDVAPLTSGSLPTAPDVGRVTSGSPATVEGTSLNTPSSDAMTLTTSSPLAAPDAGRVARAVPEEAAISASVFEASRKGKGKVSV